MSFSKRFAADRLSVSRCAVRQRLTANVALAMGIKGNAPSRKIRTAPNFHSRTYMKKQQKHPAAALVSQAKTLRIRGYPFYKFSQKKLLTLLGLPD
jgi:hypothetical protein